jgi:peroxiredoxin/outer membrane lipoprotein-sorting protein
MIIIPLFSQNSQDVQALLKKVSDTYKNLKSYHFEGTTTMEMKSEGLQQKMEMPMVIAAAKPGKTRLEIKNPMAGMLRVSDGETTWVYIPRLKQFTKKAAATVETAGGESEKTGLDAALVGSPLAQFEQLADKAKGAKMLREETTEIDGKKMDCYVVELPRELPKNLPVQMESSPKTLWIDKARYLVVKESFSGKMSSPMGEMQMFTMTVYNMTKTNEPISETLFTFAPPKGAKEVAELSFPGVTSLAGNEAGDFTLKDLEGREFNLKNLRGKVVLLSFWATWCGPCRLELPQMEKLHQEFKSKGLVVLGVNDEESEIAREFVKSNNYSFPTLSDTKRDVARLYKISAIPTLIVVDREGKISTHFVGVRSEQDVRAAVKKAGIE